MLTYLGYLPSYKATFQLGVIAGANLETKMAAQDSFCSLNSSNGILFDFLGQLIACFSWESVMAFSVKPR